MDQMYQDRSSDPPGRARTSCLVVLVLAIVLTETARVAAAEYGVSTYRVGIMDLNAGTLPPAGSTLIKGMFLFQGAHLDATTADGRIAAHTHTHIYATALFLAHTIDFSILGANWTLAALVPSLIADQNARIGPVQMELPAQTSTVGGLGEFEFSPCMLSWTAGKYHLAGSLFLYAPTGSYNQNRIVNTGLNRWAIEPDAGLTWIDPETGLEASIMLGYTINRENTATDYRSGDEFHADYAIVKHFATGSILGVAGYAMQQTTADSGSGDQMGAFRSRVLALGPLVGQVIRVGETPVTLTFKYEFEFAAQNYSTGNELWFSAALML